MPGSADGWTPIYRVVRRIPSGQVSTYGEVARAYLAGLRRIGADVIAVDAHGPIGQPDVTALDEIAPLLEGAVRARGRTCVYHGSPDGLGRLLRSFPMEGAGARA